MKLVKVNFYVTKLKVIKKTAPSVFLRLDIKLHRSAEIEIRTISNQFTI